MRTFLSSVVCAVLTAAFLAGAPLNLGAQSAQGGLRGIVKDAQSPIPGVTVTMVNQANGVSRETVTNGVGEYSFPAVDPGSYTVRAAVQGFKTFERKGVRISTQSVHRASTSRWKSARSRKRITVTGESPLIETTNASTGDVLDTQVARVDSDARPQRLPDGQPRSRRCRPAATRTGTACRIRSATRPCRWAAARVRANNFLSTASRSPTCRTARRRTRRIEAVQDMKVQVHTYDAEMGRTGGGVMNMAAKSGANEFHGSAYTVFRPEVAGRPAADPESCRASRTCRSTGATAAAAAADRSSRTRRSSGSPARSTSTTSRSRTRSCVPTAAELTGNFSGVTRNGAQVDHQGSADAGPCRSPRATQIPGNIIRPATRSA